ncbi:cyclin-dependent kinase inhibitor 1 isoform X2 [Diachasma alloeum]|uniref:cyclin-dependent kinase inhibitor 1 isoform X2 n=1 Tax=Diachasma alloeum TaxID=454923 RepID=UPI00073844A7|nr:cyclin-dependent kinase inhibitor 1 isoform X2 [Diachasma alloeum]
MLARLAMEEGNGETQALKLKNVRRRLFKDDEDEATTEPQGNADNEANRFVEKARESFEQAKEKWNFDFDKGEPLPGRYEWIKADEDFPPDESPPPAQEPDENSTTTGNAQLSDESTRETS